VLQHERWVHGTMLRMAGDVSLHGDAVVFTENDGWYG
jgi:hypothetical protein